MRQRLWLFAAAIVFATALGGCAATYYDESPGPAPDAGSYDADYGYFYDALSPYGAWYDVEPYGWVWTPYDVPVGWRPYTYGHWAYTDYGWTWLSDDPWGWAPYHYGRWTWDRYYGWLWVPGNVWAPAWVAWRYGDGWIGWAPLPPDVGWNVGVGLDYGSYDIDRDLSMYRWSFCNESDFTSTRLRTVIVPRSRNVTLLRTTRDVTRYQQFDTHPAERGLTREMLERDLRRKIPKYDVSDAPAVGRDRAAVVRGNVVEIYRPSIRDRAPTGSRNPPSARNRPGEDQRIEERNRARTEARQQRAESATDARDRSQVETPGTQRDRPKVQAPAPGAKPSPRGETQVSSPPPGVAEADRRAAEAEAQRRAAEQKELEARIKAQRQELKQEQQKDIKSPPPGVSRAELQKRHEEEQKAQAEVEKRDREELKNREERQRQWQEQQAREQDQKRAAQEQRKSEQQQQRDQQRQERDQQKQQKKQDGNSGRDKGQDQERGQTRQR